MYNIQDLRLNVPPETHSVWYKSDLKVKTSLVYSPLIRLKLGTSSFGSNLLNLCTTARERSVLCADSIYRRIRSKREIQSHRTVTGELERSATSPAGVLKFARAPTALGSGET
ncbi:hypothetical protein EVAR_62867_1 [Eumeta japonica]|uniref:Uncharacterized protein n=1 Tax=Eumeta variegata TaxID=151549 RepID=A0A4C1YZT9_EUMVA|nr:hypothetical protein EVAR_62867_1 [Eumeta japonica]